MKWTKATEMVEVVPEYKPVFARLVKEEIFSSGFFTRDGELFICHCDDYPIDSTRFNDLEILDESPLPSTEEELKDEAEELYPFIQGENAPYLNGLAEVARKAYIAGREKSLARIREFEKALQEIKDKMPDDDNFDTGQVLFEIDDTVTDALNKVKQHTDGAK